MWYTGQLESKAQMEFRGKSIKTPLSNGVVVFII